jgi:hypothetical protein
MTTANKQVKAKIDQYILNAIDGEGYERTPETDQQKLLFLATTFKSEYCYPDNFRRFKTVQEVLRQWAMGAPSSFNIDYTNYDILKAAQSFGNLPETMSEKEEEKIILNWFNFIASKTLQLMNQNGIPTSFFTENLKN